MNVTYYGVTYHLETEAELWRFLGALGTLRALAA